MVMGILHPSVLTGTLSADLTSAAVPLRGATSAGFQIVWSGLNATNATFKLYIGNSPDTCTDEITAAAQNITTASGTLSVNTVNITLAYFKVFVGHGSNTQGTVTVSANLIDT